MYNISLKLCPATLFNGTMMAKTSAGMFTDSGRRLKMFARNQTSWGSLKMWAMWFVIIKLFPALCIYRLKCCDSTSVTNMMDRELIPPFRCFDLFKATYFPRNYFIWFLGARQFYSIKRSKRYSTLFWVIIRGKNQGLIR